MKREFLFRAACINPHLYETHCNKNPIQKTFEIFHLTLVYKKSMKQIRPIKTPWDSKKIKSCNGESEKNLRNLITDTNLLPDIFPFHKKTKTEVRLNSGPNPLAPSYAKPVLHGRGYEHDLPNFQINMPDRLMIIGFQWKKYKKAYNDGWPSMAWSLTPLSWSWNCANIASCLGEGGKYWISGE